MSSSRLTQVLLALIALFLGVLALRPYVHPTAVSAQSEEEDPLYVEPGIYLLRSPGGGQSWGKVVTNLRTGVVTGYPTTNADPYPVNPLDGAPMVSKGMPLGRFVFDGR